MVYGSMIEENYHNPVMVEECMTGLAIRKSGIYVDGTLGGGGHFSAIAAQLTGDGVLLGIDRDPHALAWVNDHLPATAATLIVKQARFSEFDKVLAEAGIDAVDGILLDLGISSRQIDDAARGFAYMRDAPLDMRMNPGQGPTAAEVLADADEAELARILSTFGEVLNPMRMAGAIKRFAAVRPIVTSGDLKQCLHREYGAALPIKVLAKVFQALRIAVNAELDELRICLEKATRFLRVGGRLAVLSYHSLEDRIVKQYMRDGEGACICPPEVPRCTCSRVPLIKRVNRKSLRPQTAEVACNQRARSARLRIAERVAA
jgi:16S rRNA (cytosine1402-N4)-methyltransferase